MISTEIERQEELVVTGAAAMGSRDGKLRTVRKQKSVCLAYVLGEGVEREVSGFIYSRLTSATQSIMMPFTKQEAPGKEQLGGRAGKCELSFPCHATFNLHQNIEEEMSNSVGCAFMGQKSAVDGRNILRVFSD